MKKRIAFSLGLLQSFVAIMALPAGLLLLIDTTGASLGLQIDLLKPSPFSDYLIPGIFLFVGNGLGHLIGATLSFRKNNSAGIAGIVLGIFLLFWIIIQVYYVGFVHFLQPTFFVVAMIEIILGVLIYLKWQYSYEEE